MEAKDAVKEISARQLLLAPIYLLHEVYAALIPGILFLLLFLLKGSRLIASAVLATAMLGYTTKIVLALLVAFVIGKITLSSVSIVTGFLEVPVHWLKKKLEERRDRAIVPKGTPQKKLTEADKRNRQMLTGVLKGIILSKEGSYFDLHERQRSTAGFLLNSGLVMLIASCYPGDGLRSYELAGGVILLVAGLKESMELPGIATHTLGLGLGSYFSQRAASEKWEPAKLLEAALTWLGPDFVLGETKSVEEQTRQEVETHEP